MIGVPFITVEDLSASENFTCERISTHMQLHLLKEIVDENPFLGKFYENIDEWGFQIEMFFFATDISN